LSTEAVGLAMWQVSARDEETLLAELARLDAERSRLDDLIREAVDRKRYSSDPEQRARASAEERCYLAEMDRLMTRIRGLEGRLYFCTRKALRWDPREPRGRRIRQ
jgi:hypothetical protein